jgi:hypothetical protein
MWIRIKVKNRHHIYVTFKNLVIIVIFSVLRWQQYQQCQLQHPAWRDIRIARYATKLTQVL